VKGGVFVCAAEACDEGILERPDGAFGGITTMDVRENKLEVEVLGAQKIFQDAAAFVVEALSDGRQGGLDKDSMGAFVGGQDFGGGFVFHGLGVDVIAVVVVEGEEFVGAGGGRSDETTSLISEDLAHVGHAGGEAKVRANAGGGAEGESIVGKIGGA
jgi:hypothetical protein